MTQLQEKLVATFKERRNSLIQDGYVVIVNVVVNNTAYCKMRHNNGNYVCLVAYCSDLRLVQRTNGKVTHCETMC